MVNRACLLTERDCEWAVLFVKFSQSTGCIHTDIYGRAKKKLSSMWKWIGRRTRKIHWTFNFFLLLWIWKIFSQRFCIFETCLNALCTFGCSTTFSHEWQFFMWIEIFGGWQRGFDVLHMQIRVNIDIKLWILLGV